MAKVENIVPFILYYEAGGAKSCFKTVTVDGKKKRVYDPSLLPFEKQFEECRKTGLATTLTIAAVLLCVALHTLPMLCIATASISRPRSQD